MRLGLISNPTSGHGRRTSAASLAWSALARRGHEVLVATQHSYDSSRRAATRLVDEEDIDALVVVGGDGMVHLGLSVVATTGVPMGIVPNGTGNDVARHFGLPSGDVEKSVEIIDAALTGRGRIKDCDAIHVTRPDGGPVAPEHQWCMAIVGVGIDAAVNKRANGLRWPHGEARYTVAVAPELVDVTPYGYRVTTDAGTWEGPAVLLSVANTRFFGGGMEIAPGASTSDGLLEVYRLAPLGRLRLVRLLTKVFSGAHVGDPALHHEKTRSVTISAWAGSSSWLAEPPNAFADGEANAGLPLRLEAVPGAVRLLLPSRDTVGP